MDSAQQTLAEAYYDVLNALPQHWLDRSKTQDPEYAKLSGLFLPGTSASYQSAPQKIMVVGRETRRWDVLRGDDKFQSLEDYICKAMTTQQDHLAKFIRKPRDRGESFFNLLRDLADDHGVQSLAWANLFSFAWNKKSPMRWEHFPTLLEISERLLKAQIEVLRPDIHKPLQASTIARIEGKLVTAILSNRAMSIIMDRQETRCGAPLLRA